MTIERYRNDNPRSADEVATAIETELNTINDSLPTIIGTQNYAYVQSFARTIAAQQEQSLNDLYDAGFITDASGEELTKRAREIGVQRQAAVPATGVVQFNRDSPASQDRVIPSGTQISTGGDDAVLFQTTTSSTITGPYDDIDETTYSTTDTSPVTKTTVTVDTSFRDIINVSADLQIDDSQYTVSVDVVDVTNSTNIITLSTSNTSFTMEGTEGTELYDVTGLSGDIDIEFQMYVSNSSGTGQMQNATVSPEGQYSTLCDISASEAGPGGNVGSNTIVTMIDAPPGVDSVTNPIPTGDSSLMLTDGTTPLVTGQNEEGDESLRTRSLDSTAIGGAGTAAAAELALENVDEVESAHVFTNRSDAEDQNIDPWHTEVRVYGGSINDIANLLYDVFPLSTLKTLQGGANGTRESITLTLSDLYGELEIPITRPTEVSLVMEVDVVHDSAYAGATDVQDAIVEYIGGTTSDESNAPGLGQGENVLVNIVENACEDVTGVDFADLTLLDSNDDGTDDTITDPDGVPVFELTESEVAIVDADDITVNETAR